MQTTTNATECVNTRKQYWRASQLCRITQRTAGSTRTQTLSPTDIMSRPRTSEVRPTKSVLSHAYSPGKSFRFSFQVLPVVQAGFSNSTGASQDRSLLWDFQARLKRSDMAWKPKARRVQFYYRDNSQNLLPHSLAWNIYPHRQMRFPKRDVSWTQGGPKEPWIAHGLISTIGGHTYRTNIGKCSLMLSGRIWLAYPPRKVEERYLGEIGLNLLSKLYCAGELRS